MLPPPLPDTGDGRYPECPIPASGCDRTTELVLSKPFTPEQLAEAIESVRLAPVLA